MTIPRKFCAQNVVPVSHFEGESPMGELQVPQGRIKRATQRKFQRQNHHLVSAAMAGSRSAFSELFELYYRSILRRTLAITKNRADAEDALQETFLKAYSCLHQFQGRASFYTWLQRIAVNSSLMILRRRRVRCEVSTTLHTDINAGLLEIDCDVQDERPNQEAEYSRFQQHMVLRDSINSLPDRFRTAAELIIVRERSTKETCSILGISEPALKSLLFRARRSLADFHKATLEKSAPPDR
jgi:RNA polymerase sigma-70 factor (ECF subfamily)